MSTGSSGAAGAAAASHKSVAATLFEETISEVLWQLLSITERATPEQVATAKTTFENALSRALLEVIMCGPECTSLSPSALPKFDDLFLKVTETATTLLAPSDVTSSVPPLCHSPSVGEVLEGLFVLVSTSIHTYTLAAGSGSSGMAIETVGMTPAGRAASPASKGAVTSAVAPPAPPPPPFYPGVCAAAEGLASAVFLLHASYTSPDDTVAKDRVASLKAAVMQVWYTGLFAFLQQLSSQSKDLTKWVTFFAQCKVAAVSSPISDDDEDEEVEGREGQVDSRGVYGAFTAEQRRQARLEGLRAWGCVSPALIKETIARTRFRRAALLFKASTPHMVTQALGTTAALVRVLHEFIQAWRAAMERIPYGQLSVRAVQHITGEQGEGCDENDDREGAPSAATMMAGGDSTFDSASMQGLSAAEMDLLTLLGQSSKELGHVMGESSAHGYLVATIFGAVMCAEFILPGTRNATSVMQKGSGVGAGAGTTAAAAAAAAAPGVGITTALTSTGISAAAEAKGLEALEMATVSWLLRRPIGDVAQGWCSSCEWRLRQFPPLGLLLRRLRVRSLLLPHFFYLSTQLRIGLTAAQQTEGRQKFATTVLLCGCCDAQSALLLYHFATDPPEPNDGRTGPDPVKPSAALSRFTTAMHKYVMSAYMEMIINPAASPVVADERSSGGVGTQDAYSGRGGRRGRGGALAESRGCDAVEVAPVTLPRHGELTGERFSKLVCPVPLPVWTQFLVQDTPQPATGAAAGVVPPPPVTTVTPKLVSPCRFALELLVAGYYDVALALLEHLQRSGVNVFLIPKRSMPCTVNVQVYLMRVLSRWLSAWEDQPQQEHFEDARGTYTAYEQRGLQLGVLYDIFPLLRHMSTYAASQTVIAPLLARLAVLCRGCVAELTHSSSGTTTSTRNAITQAKQCFVLAETVLVDLVMPCLRVMTPSYLVYAYMQDIFDSLRDGAHRVGLGHSSVGFLHIMDWAARLLPNNGGRQTQHKGKAISSSNVPRRYPHEVLCSMEQRALFTQSLKRMNDASVDVYRMELRQVLFADPLFVIDRLLTQAVGYENGFLDIHTRLLRGLPGPILTLALHHGLAVMQRYAREQKLEAPTNRAGLIAKFLATLWRDNLDVDGLDGGVLLRAAELSLRGSTRADMVFGMELVRALFHQLAHRTAEHEEQFNITQLKALACPSVTRLFGRGTIESFRVGPWVRWLTLGDVAAAREALTRALQVECTVPVKHQYDDDDDDVNDIAQEEEVEMHKKEEGATPRGGSGALEKTARRRRTRTLTLGQHLLLHFCRLHSTIYELQADLEGTMETVLLTTTKDFNSLNDFILILEEMMPQGPPEALLTAVAMPHMALRLASRFCAKATAAHSNSGDVTVLDALFLSPPPPCDLSMIKETSPAEWAWLAQTCTVPFTILQQLSTFTTAHFIFEDAPYDAAAKEVDACLRKAGTKTSETYTVQWLVTQMASIRAERRMHAALVESSAASRAGLLATFVAQIFALPGAPCALASAYLLPRALLSMEDAAFVGHLLQWLHRETAKNAEHKAAVVNMMLSLVSALAAFFVGLTDGESKRAGYLLSCLMTEFLPSAQLPEKLLGVVLAAAGRTNGTDAGAGAGTAGKTGERSSGTSRGGVGFTLTASSFAAHARPQQRRMSELLRIAGISGDGTADDDDDEAKAKKKERKQPTAATTVRPGAILGDYVQRSSEEVSTSAAAAAAIEVDVPSSGNAPVYPLQLEAYLCTFFNAILTNLEDVPTHVHRNALLVLERMDKRHFPTTQTASEVLLSAVAHHTDNNMANFALATGIFKVLRESVRARRAVQVPVAMFLSTVTATAAVTSSSTTGTVVAGVPSGAADCAGGARDVEACREWFHATRMRDKYMQRLLAAEVGALRKGGKEKHAVVASEGEDENEDEKENEEDTAAEAAEGEEEAAAEGEVNEDASLASISSSSNDEEGSEYSDEEDRSGSDDDDDSNEDSGSSEGSELDSEDDADREEVRKGSASEADGTSRAAGVKRHRDTQSGSGAAEDEASAVKKSRGAQRK